MNPSEVTSIVNANLPVVADLPPARPLLSRVAMADRFFMSLAVWRELDCDTAQGWYFGLPGPPDTIAQLICPNSG